MADLAVEASALEFPPKKPVYTRRNALRSIGAVILTPPAVALAAPVTAPPVEAPPTPAVPRTNATRAANATTPRPANATATRPANASSKRPANATATRPANATATRPQTPRQQPGRTPPRAGGQRDETENRWPNRKKKKKKPQLAKANVTEALSKNNMVVKRQKLILTEFVVDPKTGDELRELRLPPWWPRSLRPPRVLSQGAQRRIGAIRLRGRWFN